MNPELILRKEFKDLKHNPLSISGYTIELFNQYDIYEWKITLEGAKDTPYSDGIFLIKLKFPKDYPKSAPGIFFLTRIYHMNVRRDGFVGVNFIYEWKEKTSVREILTKLYSIFYLVNPESPYDTDLAHLYKSDRNLYYLNAEKYTKQYAKNNNNENIKLNFMVNGEGKIYNINCNSNMRIGGELRAEIERMIGIHLIVPLFIYEGKRLNECSTVGENGLKNEGFVTIIHEVHY